MSRPSKVTLDEVYVEEFKRNLRSIGVSEDDPRAAYKAVAVRNDYVELFLAGSIGLTEFWPLLRLIADGNVYRIEIKSIARVEVMCFGLESIDTELEGYYDSLEALPNWVQERIALLSMIDATPPTEEVEHIGRRINQSTYWVYKPNK